MALIGFSRNTTNTNLHSAKTNTFAKFRDPNTANTNANTTNIDPYNSKSKANSCIQTQKKQLQTLQTLFFFYRKNEPWMSQSATFLIDHNVVDVILKNYVSKAKFLKSAVFIATLGSQRQDLRNHTET